MNPLQTLYDDSKKRRVVVFQRGDGTFGFEHERFAEDPLEMTWIPVGRTDARCDTVGRALAEARARVSWLAEADSSSEHAKA